MGVAAVLCSWTKVVIAICVYNSYTYLQNIPMIKLAAKKQMPLLHYTVFFVAAIREYECCSKVDCAMRFPHICFANPQP